MPTTVGQPAPDLTFTTHRGETHRLADFRGSQAVVLAFYGRDHGNN